MKQAAVKKCQQIVGFQFEGQELGVVMDESGEPWFPLREVCHVLGLDPRSTAKFRLQDKGVEEYSYPSVGGAQQATYINEPNLYRVIFRSNKPEALVFQDWIFEHVLPELRTTSLMMQSIGQASSQPKGMSISPGTYADLYKDRAELLEIKAMRSRKTATLVQVFGLLDTSFPMEEIAVKAGLNIEDIVHIDAQRRRLLAGGNIAWPVLLTGANLAAMLGHTGNERCANGYQSSPYSRRVA